MIHTFFGCNYCSYSFEFSSRIRRSRLPSSSFARSRASLFSLSPRNLVSYKGKKDDVARHGDARVVSDIFVTIARCRVPDYPAPRGELFLRRDSTQAALSRLSRPGEENIKLVPCCIFTIRACYARQSLLHAFFLTILIHSDLRRSDSRVFRIEPDARCRLHHPSRKHLILRTHMYI